MDHHSRLPGRGKRNRKRVPSEITGSARPSPSLAGARGIRREEILRDFGAQVWGVAWVLIAFNLVLALVAVPAARVCVRRDRAAATAAGLIAFAAATTVCACGAQGGPNRGKRAERRPVTVDRRVGMRLQGRFTGHGHRPISGCLGSGYLRASQK